MKRSTPVFAIYLVCLFSQQAQALWGRSESLEWWTNIGDIVVVVDVVSTKPIEPLNEYWQSHEVRCTPTATLKGEKIDSFTFRQNYRKKEYRTDTHDAILRPKTKALLFLVRGARKQKIEIVFWVNLTKPDAKFSSHAPYNNDCKWLADGDSVVALVKARITRESPQERTKKRGVRANIRRNFGI